MINFLGENYYIDIKEIEKQVSFDTLFKNENGEEIKEQQISVTKWEVLKMMIDVILSENENIDETLGIQRSNELSIPFKMAFNTLLINKIIKKI